MIELTHVATGALIGGRCNGPLEAVLAGVATHALMDIAPHDELHDVAFEASSAVVGILALARRHGLGSPIVWGAVGGVLPDIEHVLPAVIRPRQPLFPTHRVSWLHSAGPFRVPVWLQVIAGGAIIGALASRVRSQPVTTDRGHVVRLRNMLRP